MSDQAPSIDPTAVNTALLNSGYVSTTGLPTITWFGDNPTMAGELGALVLDGIKTATAGLLWKWEADRRPIPQPGDRQVIVEWSGRPLCVIEMTGVSVVPFERVTADFARLEAEGDLSLAYWRQIHWAFFAREARRIGREPTHDMPVICMQFRTVHTVGPEVGAP